MFLLCFDAGLKRLLRWFTPFCEMAPGNAFRQNYQSVYIDRQPRSQLTSGSLVSLAEDVPKRQGGILFYFRGIRSVVFLQPREAERSGLGLCLRRLTAVSLSLKLSFPFWQLVDARLIRISSHAGMERVASLCNADATRA